MGGKGERGLGANEGWMDLTGGWEGEADGAVAWSVVWSEKRCRARGRAEVRGGGGMASSSGGVGTLPRPRATSSVEAKRPLPPFPCVFLSVSVRRGDDRRHKVFFVFLDGTLAVMRRAV